MPRCRKIRSLARYAFPKIASIMEYGPDTPPRRNQGS